MEGRQFQLWEYRVSHGSLLIRSPAGPGIETSVDIVCVGVEYIAAPSYLGEVVFSDATSSEMQMLSSMLRKPVSSSQVWVLEGLFGRCLLVAVALIVKEHLGDIFESPFSN
jgi:hypothetical protein